MSVIQYRKLEKSSRQPVTAADFTRVLERNPKTSQPYPGNTIYPSGLYETPIVDFVMSYYSPQIVESDWKRDMYVSHGHTAERIIQDRLFRAGVLDCPHETFQETVVWCPELRVKGRTDGIIIREKMKHAGAVKTKDDQYTGPATHDILEIKETGSYQFQQIKTVDDIPLKFQWAQAVYQHILGIPSTCFLYVNRDSMDLKTMFYSAPNTTVHAAIDKIHRIWHHIDNRTIPGPDGDVAFESYE